MSFQRLLLTIKYTLAPISKFSTYLSTVSIQNSMFLSTLFISLLNLTVVLVTSQHSLSYNDGFVSNKGNNAFQTTYQVKEILYSTEENEEIASTEIENNVSQKQGGSNNSSKPSLIENCTIHLLCGYCDYISSVYNGRLISADANLIFQSSDSIFTHLEFTRNTINSNVVLTVNIPGNITSTNNMFISNALLIVNAYIHFIEIVKNDFQNFSLQISNNVKEFVDRYSTFNSDLYISGNLSNLKFQDSEFASNSLLTISEPMDKLTFSSLLQIPMLNIKSRLRELYLVNIYFLNFNSKMHPNIENIDVYCRIFVRPHPYRFRLSVKNKPTLILNNIGMQQTENISSSDNEIKQIMIGESDYKVFNFSGYSALEILYLHVENSRILISPSLKKVYITGHVNFYVSSMEAEIEIESTHYDGDDKKYQVISNINCHNKSSIHKNVNLFCFKTLPTNLQELNC
ncbi:hypothetical protein GJ496_002591 [Pomphorhynchus laevis]|nr:hypothetical protein GJ496_002591 [Pomphorhynchus laevis]